MSKYLGATETAKVVRKMLKKHFSDTKFSVRSESYSMGSAVNVKWIDGPTESEVNSVVGVLAGSGFDGMIDLKYGITHWMNPDGSICLANSQGSSGSGGLDDAIHNPKPHPDSIEVTFADHISCTRKYSTEFLDKIANRINERMFAGKPVVFEENGYLNTTEMIMDNVFWRIQAHSKVEDNKIICDEYMYGDIITE